MTVKFRYIILSALLTFSMYSDCLGQQKFYKSFQENYGRREYDEYVEIANDINSDDTLNIVIKEAYKLRSLVEIAGTGELKKESLDATTLNILLAYERLKNPNSLKNHNIKAVLVALQSAEEYQQSIYLASNYLNGDEIEEKSKIYAIRGISKYNLSDYYGAIADMSKAIKMGHITAENYTVRAISYHAVGNFEDAKKDYTYIIENLLFRVAEAYVGRAMVKLDEGDKQAGCMDLSKAGEKGFSEAYEYIKEYCN